MRTAEYVRKDRKIRSRITDQIFLATEDAAVVGRMDPERVDHHGSSIYQNGSVLIYQN
jgi:hypothetical protein